MDEKRYPRVAAYLGQLPAGLDSHPECQAKASGYRASLERLPLDGVAPGALPDGLMALVESPAARSEWVPEVRAMALGLALADHHDLSDAAFLRFVREVNAELLGSRTYRYLMAGDRSALPRHAGVRWQAMHRGVKLTGGRLGEHGWRFRMGFPAHLYNELLLQAFARTFEATLSLSEAHATVALSSFSDRWAHYEARWERTAS